jgi:hypothetical protein
MLTGFFCQENIMNCSDVTVLGFQIPLEAIIAFWMVITAVIAYVVHAGDLSEARQNGFGSGIQFGYRQGLDQANQRAHG